MTCSQCGTAADSDRIFCVRCGAVLRNPTSLLQSDSSTDDTVTKVSALKRALTVVVKAIGAIAALTFWFSRVTTNFGIVLFGASIVVGLLCVFALSYLDDDFLKGNSTAGYWPSKPLDWDTPAHTNQVKTHDLN